MLWTMAKYIENLNFYLAANEELCCVSWNMPLCAASTTGLFYQIVIILL